MAGRRFALYFSWSRSQEISANLGKLENRYPTLFEFRRAIWPNYEHEKDSKQDISGFLDRVILSDFEHFRKIVYRVTDCPVALFQREQNQSCLQKLDREMLEDIDTLIVISLDHFKTEQKPDSQEIEAINHFLKRKDACLLVCPQHDIGAREDLNSREVEFYHHGDRLVPEQQRIGGFARSLLNKLGFPIENRFGLNPAKSPKDNSPAPLLIFHDSDELKILEGVTTFNLHSHLPHYFVPDSLKKSVYVLAKQLINPEATKHPFVEAGNRYFNALLWIPPNENRLGNIFVCDSTLWSSAFGGVSSLEVFWKNLATLQ